MRKPDIKPVQTQLYKLAIVDSQPLSFLLLRLSDGQQSAIYSGSLGALAYDCLISTHKDGEKFFDSLCELEFKNV